MKNGYSIEESYDPSSIITHESDPTQEFNTWREGVEDDPEWRGDEFTLEDFEGYIDGLIRDHLKDSGVAYAKQASKPRWYIIAEEVGMITECATSGSSPFNEWYAFEGRETAVDYIDKHFEGQSFIDGFQMIDGEFYAASDYTVTDPGDGESLVFEKNSGAEPADIGSMVLAESDF